MAKRKNPLNERQPKPIFGSLHPVPRPLVDPDRDFRGHQWAAFSDVEKALARALFEGYRDEALARREGSPQPIWHDLYKGERLKWCAAARAALEFGRRIVDLSDAEYAFILAEADPWTTPT